MSLWWPNGYGDPKLYLAYVSIDCWRYLQRPQSIARTTSEKTFQIAFRTVELIQENNGWLVDFHLILVVVFGSFSVLQQSAFCIEIILFSCAVEFGRSFYFKINNQSLFMKGANYLPVSILPEDTNDKQKGKQTVIILSVNEINELLQFKKT